ncbi:MAG: signal peptide peptidase SppA [Bacteroidetes bacterium]|nr:signal peptide peptidase SppA [Bacteroidota bacterium]
MKQFFASCLGSIIGLFIAFFLVVIIGIAIVASAISSTEETKTFKPKDNSVLHIKLDKEIPERSSKNPFENFDFGSMEDNKSVGLNDILASIKNAKTDEKIKGIFLDLSFIPARMATLEEVRNALIDFKTSGKFIFSYSEIYEQDAYYLASVSDKVYLNPYGMLEFKGVGAQVMYFKTMLEKLEVQPQIFKHGKFKSAVEPFDHDKMTPENREQIRTYAGSLWTHVLEGVSKERKISVEELRTISNDLLIRTPEDAVKYKLADKLAYKDEFLDDLKEKLGIKKDDKISTVSLEKYSKFEDSDKKETKDKIAIVYAVGEIQGGEGDDETIGSDRISEAIRKARKDSSIKAVVLRVNSPGGSALASEVIWREVMLTKKEKPVVVSMGDVAASGGYYIACGADAIVAEPNTITGSIGVFGMLFNMKNLFNNKLGINIDTVKIGKYSDLGTPFRAVTTEEGAIIQNEIERIYDTFITRVADGRKITKANVDSIGQGRVWSGVDAKRIGLVDELGGIDKAIALAAQKAKLDTYKITDLPKQKDPFEEFVKEFSGDVTTKFVKNELGENYIYYKKAKEVMNMKPGVQARMEYDITVE